MRTPRQTSPSGIQQRPLMIVVIGGPDALADAARRVALVHIGAAVAVATGVEVLEVVKSCRPFAILISTELCDVDRRGFAKIARGVGATLLPVDTQRHLPEQIDSVIKPRLLAAAKAYARS